MQFTPNFKGKCKNNASSKVVLFAAKCVIFWTVYLFLKICWLLNLSSKLSESQKMIPRDCKIGFVMKIVQKWNFLYVSYENFSLKYEKVVNK